MQLVFVNLHETCERGDAEAVQTRRHAANLRTKILDFRGFDSSIILIIRGGSLMSIGSSPEVLSQRILVEVIVVGRWGTPVSAENKTTQLRGKTPLRRQAFAAPIQGEDSRVTLIPKP